MAVTAFTSSSEARFRATSEIAIRADPSTPETLAVKLFDCRDPSYMKMRSAGMSARAAISSSASRTGPAGTGRYWLNKGSIKIGDNSMMTASAAAVSPPDQIHQRRPVRLISA
jgi:hypothetical protein